jgi:hypothetical protein
MRTTIPVMLLTATFSGLCLGASDATPFKFDRNQLSGWWAESFNTDLACGPDNVRTTMEVSPDGKRLEMRFDRKWKTELGETDHFGATIVSATSRTLIIRYENEKRVKPTGGLVEWELAIVAPGVYRWRETAWRSGEVNTVVGVRCPT